MDSKCPDAAAPLRRARVSLLVASSMALMLALMLPGEAPQERKVRIHVSPKYPELARRLGIVGRVRLRVLVDCVGTVLDAKAIYGNLLLTEAAEEAVRQWRFTSGDGSATIDVDLEFSLAA
jgi:TonB family protein